MLMVEDYAYAGIDFTGDPDLPLPPGGKWGDIGKKKETLIMENVFMFFMFYIFYDKWRDLFVFMQMLEQWGLEEHLH